MMLHALNAKKARLDRLIYGVAKQPREDLITSTLLGSIEFLPDASRSAALKGLVGFDLGPASKIQLWPRFHREPQRVEPDVVIMDGRECHVVEVKWGAHLGIGQIERQLEAVARWDCRKYDRDVLGAAPRIVKSLTVLGFERHHAPQVAACDGLAVPVRQRSWQDVARDMWDLRGASDSALAAWARQVHQFLTSTPKARTMQGWPDLMLVVAGRLSFDAIGLRELKPVPAMAWAFPADQDVLN